MKTNNQSEAYQSGYSAAGDQFYLDRLNPFFSGTQQHIEWEQGFNARIDEYMDQQDSIYED